MNSILPVSVSLLVYFSSIVFTVILFPTVVHNEAITHIDSVASNKKKILSFDDVGYEQTSTDEYTTIKLANDSKDNNSNMVKKSDQLDFVGEKPVQKEIEKGVWFYSGNYASLDHSMIDNITTRGINTIYFSPINDDGGWDNASKATNYLDFIRYAHSKNMKVYAVSLENSTDIFKTEQELKAEFGKSIRDTKGIFDAYMVDVEPHTTETSFVKNHPPFDENRCMYLNKYINMSKILRSVADFYNVKYIDTIPPWYHEDMKQCGIEAGINALSSHSINLMDYTSTVDGLLKEISNIRAEVTKPYVVSIKVTAGHGDPHLKEQDIPKAIDTVLLISLPIGFYEASGVMQLPVDLFARLEH